MAPLSCFVRRARVRAAVGQVMTWAKRTLTETARRSRLRSLHSWNGSRNPAADVFLFPLGLSLLLAPAGSTDSGPRDARVLRDSGTAWSSDRLGNALGPHRGPAHGIQRPANRMLSRGRVAGP
jgi:hypothetical protein